MPVTKRGKKWQATVHQNGERFRRSFNDEASAKRWEAQSKADLLAGREPESRELQGSTRRPQTLGTLLRYVTENVWKDAKSSRVLVGNAQQVVDTLGADSKIESIDRLAVDRLVEVFKSKHNSNATINRKIAALRKMLAVARELDVDVREIKFPRLREPQGRTRWYTMDEQRRFLDYLEHCSLTQWAQFFRFQLYSGMRLGEARTFQWADVHQRSVHLIDTKSGHNRTVPLSTSAFEAMDVQERSQPGPWAWVKEDRLRWVWSSVKLHMGWEDDLEANIHAMRHTFCSRLVQKGAPLAVVQELAGHRCINTTLRYAHLAPENLGEAVSLLESE